MKKIFLLMSAVLILFPSCEKDDICDSAAATTSRLVIQFYDINNRSVVKEASGLKVQGNDVSTAIVFNPSLPTSEPDRFITNDTIVALPLRIATDQTTYVFTLNADSTDPSSDTIVFNYGRNNVYVSRACGFRTIFDFSNRTPGLDAFTLNGVASGNPFVSTWIRDVEIVQANINNENETHVKIYF